jgi:hypothetical protein
LLGEIDAMQDPPHILEKVNLLHHRNMQQISKKTTSNSSCVPLNHSRPMP